MTPCTVTAALAAALVVLATPTAFGLTPAEVTRLSSQFARHDGSAVIGPRIVGGTQAVKGEFPFVVSLQTPGGAHFCGGSVLDDSHVLTAAHCVVDGLQPNGVKAVVARHKYTNNHRGQRMDVASIIVHPNYSGGDSDIAILRLATPIDMSPSTLDWTVQPVAPNVDNAGNEAPGVTATVIGWGATSEGSNSLPRKLRKVNVPLVSQATCQQQYGNGAVTDDMLCAGFAAGNKDSCQGDSGGPLFVAAPGGGHIQVGIVSWGEGCARPNRSGVYTRVSYFADWIAGVQAGGDGGDGGGGGGGGVSEVDLGDVVCTEDQACTLGISLTVDDFPEETTWQLLRGDDVVAARDPVTGDHSVSVDLTVAGDYTFVIADSFGDGICCGVHGNGEYRLSLNGQQLTTGGQFANQERVAFSLTIEPNDGGDGEPVDVQLTGSVDGVTVRQTVRVTVASGARRLRGSRHAGSHGHRSGTEQPVELTGSVDGVSISQTVYVTLP